jgi:hypothetical protein
MRHQISLLILAGMPGFAAELGSSLPLSFISNAGETDPSIQFITETPDLRAGFGANWITFRVRDQEIRLNFSKANPNVKIDGVGLMPGRANFLLGQDRRHWQTGLPTYRQIVYHGLYPGIDMVYSGEGSRVKSEFVVSPGSDPARIRLDYDSAEKVFIDSDGSLVVTNQPMELREQAPVVYHRPYAQDLDGLTTR